MNEYTFGAVGCPSVVGVCKDECAENKILSNIKLNYLKLTGTQFKYILLLLGGSL